MEVSPPGIGIGIVHPSVQVHVFDATRDFQLLQTIDDHSSSITAVRFNFDQRVLQLLSCGADKLVMFHTGQVVRAGVLIVGGGASMRSCARGMHEAPTFSR